MVAPSCLIGDALPTVLEGRALRPRGPRPKLTDADLLTLAVVGESARRDPDPARSRFLSPIRDRIETIFSQLVGRFHAKQVWARDPWHPANRFLRTILSHPLPLRLNARVANPSPPLARLLA